jgi:hypothetical protein
MRVLILVHVSSYYYMCVLILQLLCKPRSWLCTCVSSYYYMCVLILQLLCKPRSWLCICVLILLVYILLHMSSYYLYMCPHSTACIYVSSYYSCCVSLIVAVHMCPHTTMCATTICVLIYYMCVLILLYIYTRVLVYYICVRVLYVCPHTTRYHLKKQTVCACLVPW